MPTTKRANKDGGILEIIVILFSGCAPSFPLRRSERRLEVGFRLGPLVVYVGATTAGFTTSERRLMPVTDRRSEMTHANRPRFRFVRGSKRQP